MADATLFHGTGTWATFDDDHEGPRGGALLGDNRERSPFAVLCEDGFIADSGDPDTLRARHRGARQVDLGTRTVVPGFVDPHTHPVFAGSREDEFEWRNQGRPYQDIARAGGGIRKSVRQLRAASDEELVANLRATADAFLELGTTTIEAKSGYGLSTEDELRSLRAIREVADSHPLGIVPTFLGAHEVPDEWQHDREGYVRLLVEETLPAVAKQRLADACDVFCEEGVFDVGQSRRILSRARDLGLKVKMHADEITPCGGAELAAELSALSADHLVHVTAAGMRDMLRAGVIPILLPATSFVLKLARDAPAKAMVDLGLPVAIATDFNPGSSPTRSMPLVMTFACVRYGLTAAQALTAATVNAAHAIGLGDRIGRIRKGYEADFVALDVPNVRFLPYRFGENFAAVVVKGGRIVVDRRR
jgi:imidazolonepropionase